MNLWHAINFTGFASLNEPSKSASGRVRTYLEDKGFDAGVTTLEEEASLSNVQSENGFDLFFTMKLASLSMSNQKMVLFLFFTMKLASLSMSNQKMVLFLFFTMKLASLSMSNQKMVLFLFLQYSKLINLNVL